MSDIGQIVATHKSLNTQIAKNYSFRIRNDSPVPCRLTGAGGRAQAPPSSTAFD